MAGTDHADLANKCKKYLKFVYLGTCLLTICLSIAGISVAQTQLIVSQQLFIVILFFCLLSLLIHGVYKLLKGSGTSKYQISDKKNKSSGKMKKKKERSETDKADTAGKVGTENKAFDAEKGENKDEKWVKNYVPYDEYPAGSSISVESETGEKKRREEERGEKEEKVETIGEIKDEKWKQNYVPYEEENTENKNNEE